MENKLLLDMIRPGYYKLLADPDVRIILDEDYKKTWTVYRITPFGVDTLKRGIRTVKGVTKFIQKEVLI